MSRYTACPLDCYDACSIAYEDGKLLGSPDDPYTHGYLCPHMNHYDKYERIIEPSYLGRRISMEEALQILKKMFEESGPQKVLHYLGRGNFGLMQRVSEHFFASYGAALTKGSLCDGAGDAGITEGRGNNRLLPPEQIAESEVVIVWGRNIHTTNSHLLPLLKDKTVIVIDPVKTKMAETADFFLQIKPAGDIYLAMLLARFIIIEGLEDQDFLDEFADEYEDFYELTQTVRIKAILEQIDVTLGDIGNILELIRNRRCVILAGVGIQKYRSGADVMRAIDAIAVLLGLFGKEGCGVSYPGNSSEGIKTPFATGAGRENMANADFSKYNTVFVQGSNPLNQMPDTTRVEEVMQKVKNLVYFGLYENETSKKASLVIPAKNFLEKNDIRSSYGHNALRKMPMLKESKIGISEYELSAWLCREFGIEIESEEFYLEHFASFGTDGDVQILVKGRPEIPYGEGFETDDDTFQFLEELDFDFDMQNGYFLITSKSPKSLNSQFKREECVYVSPQTGFLDGQLLRIISQNGSVELVARHNGRLRSDCLLIYSGTP
ncbi:MAG: molybdopterin oxidoreductase, partial [Helicobacteraceae bacterium 4484_230]